jgi:lipopolysaccharide heptosyltransferase II
MGTGHPDRQGGAVVFEHLQIYDARERTLVGSADLLLKAYGAASRLTSRASSDPPKRILIVRLERIGDLLMSLAAIEAVRARVPDATIHLVVGSWNASLAKLVSAVDSYETLDVPWLARQDAGASMGALVARARSWRKREFDLALNFEPDIRSNLLVALSGAARRVGFGSGGGEAFLTTSLTFVPGEHTAVNAQRVVDAALPASSSRLGTPPRPHLAVPDDVKREAQRLFGVGAANRRFVGIHPSGGRVIKQWHMDRFAEVATRLARERGATIVLTGIDSDRPLVERITSQLPADVTAVNASGSLDLAIFAGLLSQLDLLVTGDTGPMHLAAAVGTRVVALFGPSDPARYGPLTDRASVVTADLWCRPCNRVRRPPERCVDRVPDCLDGIDASTVVRAALDLLDRDA